MANPPSTYNALTNRTAYTVPAESGALDLTVGGRGVNYSFTDPTFGTTITRVTDENFWPDFVGRRHIPPDTAEVRSINVDSTKFYVMNIEGGILTPCHWNGTTKTMTRMGDTGIASGGIWLSGTLTGGSALPSWSGKNPNIMWGTGGASGYKLRKLDYSTITGTSTSVPFTDIIDYGTIYNTITGGTLTGGVCSLGVSGVDATDDFIVSAMVGNQDDWTWTFWYDSATGRYKILDSAPGTVRWWDSDSPGWTDISGLGGGWSLHNVKIDQSGRYVLLTVDNRDGGLLPAGKGFLASWDTTNNTVSFTPTAVDGGHRSGGWQKMINQYANGSDASQWLMRPASDLSAATTNLVVPLLSDPSSNPQYTALNPDFDEHSSWQTARSGGMYPVFSLTSRSLVVDGGHPWRPWDDECVGVSTDGSNVIYRFFHHHSKRTTDLGSGYYDYSFGQVSPDGLYMSFGSNWNNTLGTHLGEDRSDSFMASLPVSTAAPVVKLIAICL